MMKFYMAISLNLALFCSFGVCQTAHAAHARQLSKIYGKVIDGRYVGCNNCFSVAFPSYSEPCYVEDLYMDEKLGAVAYYNEGGFFMKVEVEEVAPEATAIMTQHPHIKSEVLDAIVHEVIYPHSKEEAVGVKVLYEKKLLLENGEDAHFAVMIFPGAASIIDGLTGKGFDSTRGYLFHFSENKYLVSICVQDPYSMMPRFAKSAKAHLNERLLKQVKEIQKTFRTNA